MKINYKDSIVAFIDVLGFSNLVYSDDQSKIENYFSYILSDFNASLNSNGFKYLIISDSIVISCAKTVLNLSELIFFLGKIQYQLLLKGILIRGSVSYGNLYINKKDNIIVGPGLINAYALEKTANNPRIIIDRRFILEFNNSSISFLNSINIKFKELFNESDEKVKLEKDGTIYINYLRKFARYGPTFKERNLILIMDLFKKHYYTNQHFSKYQWVLQQMLEEILIAIEHYEKHFEFAISKSRIKKLKFFQTELLKL